MDHFVKNAVTLCLIILLLPYVLTTFINGGLEFRPNQESEADKKKEISVKEEDGKLSKMAFEDYVMGITAYEMPITYEKEALRAQTIIARTSVQKMLDQNKNYTFDLKSGYFSTSDMESSWGYERFLSNYERLKEINESTKGKVMRYHGVCIEAAFHAVSSGKTRSGREALGSEDYPYLESVDSSVDIKAENYLQTVTLSYKKVGELCNVPPLTSLPEILETDSASYATKIKIGDKTVTGEEFRKRLGLDSASISITDLDGKIKIVTKGRGHGVGLSQYGANQMAKEGKGVEEILAYYYKNIEIVSE